MLLELLLCNGQPVNRPIAFDNVHILILSNVYLTKVEIVSARITFSGKLFHCWKSEKVLTNAGINSRLEKPHSVAGPLVTLPCRSIKSSSGLML